MKKVLLILSALTALFALTAFTGCATTSEVSANAADSESHAAASVSAPAKNFSAELYDNCPKTTYALTAELALKTTIRNYSGVTEVTFKGYPDSKAVSKALEYFEFCKSISSAIRKGTESEVTLSFNTQTDKSGLELDFSSAAEAKKSLHELAESGETKVYAIYEY